MKVEIIGLDRTLMSLNGYLDRRVKEAQGVIKEGTKSIKADAQQRAPVHLGTLRNNIVQSTKKTKYTYTGNVLSRAEYSSAVEYGSRSHWAPEDSIAGWAKSHGLTPRQLKHSIAKKGTQPHPYMTPAYYDNEKDIIKGVKQVFKK